MKLDPLLAITGLVGVVLLALIGKYLITDQVNETLISLCFTTFGSLITAYNL